MALYSTDFLRVLCYCLAGVEGRKDRHVRSFPALMTQVMVSSDGSHNVVGLAPPGQPGGSQGFQVTVGQGNAFTSSSSSGKGSRVQSANGGGKLRAGVGKKRPAAKASWQEEDEPEPQKKPARECYTLRSS